MREGRLEVIYGPMFSGKSSELIRRLKEAEDAGIPTRAFKSHLDVRHDEVCISSHDGLRFPCTPIRTSAGLRDAGDASVIGIDEAQFFDRDLVIHCQELRSSGHRVIVAGLHEDYLGQPFEPLPALIAAADETTFLLASCAVCQKEARHTHRIVDAKERVVVGADEAYEPRCSLHFPFAGSSA